jgi:acyl-CoA hydrolase
MFFRPHTHNYGIKKKHYVATECGVVNLFGKNMWERAGRSQSVGVCGFLSNFSILLFVDALISIAHPSKRDELYNSLLKRAPQWRHLIRKTYSEP